MNEDTGLVKVNVLFVGVGKGWVWRVVTWPTIGCCVILKVFLGEHNGPFRVHRVPWSSSLAPGSVSFCFAGQLHSSVCLPLPFDWPGILEKGTSTDCFRTEPGMLSAGRIVYWGRGRTKSTKGTRSQQWFLETSRDKSSKETRILTAPLSHCEILQIATESSSL